MARQPARDKDVFAGTPTHANIVASLGVAEQVEPAATVVMIAVDSAPRSLSAEPYVWLPRRLAMVKEPFNHAR